jgi:xylulose-5-phosphate/fructose-6-phosphate phosphoketolase
VWRQDHNGFSHQDPGFVDLVTNKSPAVTRIYLPPDANCLLSVMDHCLKSTDYINVIISDKQKHLQYLTMEEAVNHCTKGIGIWQWASNDDQGKAPDIPDVIMACCGDIPTMESLAATAILREEFPDLRVRFINVVDLYKLINPKDHSHGLSNQDFDTLFTVDKPVIFNFHGYPWLIHKLVYSRSNQERIHVRGYKEKGNINTPLELAINNQIDRFNLVIDVINRVPKLGSAAAYVKEKMQDQIIENINYARLYGEDKPEITGWVWPY